MKLYEPYVDGDARPGAPYNAALTEVIVAKLESKPVPTKVLPKAGPVSDLAALLAFSRRP
jgi:hypothetical protein